MERKVGAEAFAERFKALREAKGWSQDTVAEKLKRGKTSLSHWETGRDQPRLKDLVAVSQLFGTTVDWLLGLEGRDDLKPLHSIAEARRADAEQERALESVARYVARVQKKHKR